MCRSHLPDASGGVELADSATGIPDEDAPAFPIHRRPQWGAQDNRVDGCMGSGAGVLGRRQTGCCTSHTGTSRMDDRFVQVSGQPRRSGGWFKMAKNCRWRRSALDMMVAQYWRPVSNIADCMPRHVGLHAVTRVVSNQETDHGRAYQVSRVPGRPQGQHQRCSCRTGSKPRAVDRQGGPRCEQAAEGAGQDWQRGATSPRV